MKLRCVILDDEFLARQLLEGYIHKIPFLELAGKYENAFAAMEMFEKDKPDILFADIDMPGLNGIEFVKTLKTRPHIILTTAYSEYALESYQLDVTDYLLKPILFERFIRAVSKAKELINLKKNLLVQESALPIETTSATKEEKYLFIKTGSQKITRIHLEDIVFIESLHEYVRIHLRQEKHIIYFSLKNLFEHLPQHQFIQIHRSYIVNFDKIDCIEGNTLKVGNTELKIGKNYREDLFIKVKNLGIGMLNQPKKQNA